MNKRLGIKGLISKTWYLLVFGLILGYGLGKVLQQTYEVEMYGFEYILAIFSTALIWAGLNVGVNIVENSK